MASIEFLDKGHNVLLSQTEVRSEHSLVLIRGTAIELRPIIFHILPINDRSYFNGVAEAVAVLLVVDQDYAIAAVEYDSHINILSDS
jgi:hypothetical protein